jgi:hypothetical protein
MRLFNAISLVLKTRLNSISVISILSLTIVSISNAALAQSQCYTSEYVALYQQVVEGRRDFNSLNQQEKSCVLMISQAMSRSSAPKNTSECEDAWDTANSAADDVATYAKRLIRCVEGGDHSDDCYSEARRVRSSHSDYESAVSDVQYECY